MMNVVLTAPSSSECSSGCESGWTLYLEHSTSNFSTATATATATNNKHQKVAAPTFHHGKKTATGSLFYNDYEDEDEDEDEDLSMVSDASSGPPHFDHEDEVFCYTSSTIKQPLKLSSTTTLLHHQQQQHFTAQDFGLDDTASSPLFTSQSERNNGRQNNNNNKGSSLKRMVDYSSQGFSATHFHQERSTDNFEEHYGFIQPPFSTNLFQHNHQWS